MTLRSLLGVDGLSKRSVAEILLARERPGRGRHPLALKQEACSGEGGMHALAVLGRGAVQRGQGIQPSAIREGAFPLQGRLLRLHAGSARHCAFAAPAGEQCRQATRSSSASLAFSPFWLCRPLDCCSRVGSTSLYIANGIGICICQIVSGRSHVIAR